MCIIASSQNNILVSSIIVESDFYVQYLKIGSTYSSFYKFLLNKTIQGIRNYFVKNIIYN